MAVLSLLAASAAAACGETGASATTATDQTGHTAKRAVAIAENTAQALDGGSPDAHQFTTMVESDEQRGVAFSATSLVDGWLFRVSLWKRCASLPANVLCGQPSNYYVIVRDRKSVV